MSTNDAEAGRNVYYLANHSGQVKMLFREYFYRRQRCTFLLLFHILHCMIWRHTETQPYSRNLAFKIMVGQRTGHSESWIKCINKDRVSFGYSEVKYEKEKFLGLNQDIAIFGHSLWNSNSIFKLVSLWLFKKKIAYTAWFCNYQFIFH